MAESRLEHAGIAAIALAIARAQHLEQLLHHRQVADLRDRLPASVEVSALAQRDELLDHRAQILRLRQRGDDLLVLDQSRRHVREHCAPVLRRAVELAMGVTMTYVRLQRTDNRGQMKTTLIRRLSSVLRHLVSNDPRTAWPAHRYCRAASPALPCRDAAPSGRALP